MVVHMDVILVFKNFNEKLLNDLNFFLNEKLYSDKTFIIEPKISAMLFISRIRNIFQKLLACLRLKDAA